MPTTSENPHTRHSSSGRHSQENSIRKGNMEQVFHVGGAITLVILARLFHVSLISPVLGAAGILLLTASKRWRFRQGVLASIFSMFGMTMFFAWKWVDTYVIAILSEEILTKPMLFATGLAESLILIIMVWMFKRSVGSIHMRLSQDWFVKKLYVKLFEMVFYFQLFLMFCWVFAFILLTVDSLTGLEPRYSALLAGAIALLSAGIPAIAYLINGPHVTHKHRHSRHHHRDESETS